jgi:hypothetical protein
MPSSELNLTNGSAHNNKVTSSLWNDSPHYQGSNQLTLSTPNAASCTSESPPLLILLPATANNSANGQPPDSTLRDHPPTTTPDRTAHPQKFGKHGTIYSADASVQHDKINSTSPLDHGTVLASHNTGTASLTHQLSAFTYGIITMSIFMSDRAAAPDDIDMSTPLRPTPFLGTPYRFPARYRLASSLLMDTRISSPLQNKTNLTILQSTEWCSTALHFLPSHRQSGTEWQSWEPMGP